jgi:hypothetical protein
VLEMFSNSTQPPRIMNPGFKETRPKLWLLLKSVIPNSFLPNRKESRPETQFGTSVCN